MAQGRRGKWSRRSAAGLTVALALAVGACGSDAATTPSTTTAAETGVSTVAPTAATAATTNPAATATAAATTAATAAATTAATTTAGVASTSTAPAAVAGVVTPVVVCVDPQRGAAYFGYANSGTAPVEIAVGAGNHVALPDGTQLTDQQPSVFAAGDQGVVFWTELVDATSAPTWTLTGADGIARAARADAAAPTCADGRLPLDPPDERVARVVGTVDTAGSSPSITITVAGLPDASRCPSGTGWTSSPVRASIDAAGGNVTTQAGDEPSTMRLTVDDPASAPAAGFDVAGFASVSVAVDVEDRCTDAAGHTSRAWGASESLRDLSQVGTKICFGELGDGYGEVDCGEGPTLAPTGGIRTR